MPDDAVRFAPSRVDGLASVTEAAVFPDRLELTSPDERRTVRFLQIARWQRFGVIYRAAARLGLGVRGFPTIADRDWFHPPADRFFRFYTSPPLTVFLTDEPPGTSYERTLFRRIHDMIGQGGFGTFDLG